MMDEYDDYDSWVPPTEEEDALDRLQVESERDWESENL